MLFRKYKYDVAFSFAEENYTFVEEVVGFLKHRNPNYYYYKEDLVLAWGKDLGKAISPVYQRQSRLCVVFVSASYREKVWTKFELKKAQIKARRGIQEYILPFKLDDTELPEIPPTIKYLSIRDFDASMLADAICRKIDEHKKRDKFLIRLYGIIRYYTRMPVTLFALLALLSLYILIRDRLTPVDELTTRLYERSKERRKGSVCRDSSYSMSRGSGTCSHHGGVQRKKDSMISTLTLEECREMAKDISWLGG